MIPTTLLALVVFAASIGPGFVYYRVAEGRKPRHERTPLLEAAELILVGAVSSSIALLIVLSIGKRAYFIDSDALARRGSDYLLEEPQRTLVSALAVLALGALFAGLIARAANPTPRVIEPGSVWYRALNPQPGGLEPRTHGTKAFVTAELRDRRVVSGWVYAFTEEASPENTVLALHKPLFARSTAEQERREIGADLLVLRANEVMVIAVQYRRG
jgi:hypothetical protein